MKNLVSHTYLLQPSELVAFTIKNLKSTEELSEIVEKGLALFEDDACFINCWRKHKNRWEIVVHVEAFAYWQGKLIKKGYKLTECKVPTGEFKSIQLSKLSTGEFLWVEYDETFAGLEFLDFDLELAFKS